MWSTAWPHVKEPRAQKIDELCEVSDLKMAYEPPYYNECEQKNEDLHNYFMTQFNLELENKPKKLDNFKHGTEESINFDAIENWNQNSTDFGLDSVIENDNVSDESIKDVLLDLDSLEYDTSDNAAYKTKIANTKHKTNDYIDDESLIDELCREESDSRLTPDIFNDDYLSAFTKEKKLLPSMETAFSKKFCNYNPQQTNGVVIQNLEYYSYPNNIIQNLESESYVLPDTPTSCTEFSYDRTERKVSVCESIESDLQSSSYYDGNSETFDEDELFVNLDDFGLHFEEDAVPDAKLGRHCERIADNPKHGDRHCLWESCFEKYPSQSTLVEHIERAHVNTYKGDEFSCLWQNCARSRRPFNARYKLLIHMRVHSGHKPNRCHHPGCGKAFSRLENLKIHMRSHTGERPYACPAPHCRKAFSNSSDRAKHQRTHFNARPYACGAPGCGKRYTDPSSLRKHVKSHPHVTTVPRTCVIPSRPFKRAPEQMVPSSPAKLTTMRSIRDKLTVSRMQAV